MTSINNQSELINWATDSNNVGTLTADITLSGGTWPLSLNNNKTLDGNGYTITIHSGMVDGIFILNTNGYNSIIQNLIVDADAVTTFNTAAGILFAQTSADDLSITATNCGCIGSFGYGNSGGFIVGNMLDSTNGDLLIKNCFSTGTISGDFSGGIIGAWSCIGSGSAKIHNCFSTGEISGTRAGGIAGSRFGRSNTIDGDAIITNCYSLGDITSSSAGGIVGAFVGGNTDNYVLIGNCYSLGDITNNGGGIAGELAYGGNLTIENCHSVYATGNGVGNKQIIKSEQQTGSTINDCSAGSGTWTPNLGTILIDNYTDSSGVFTDSNVWITSGGSFANGYGLNVFATSPWNSSIYTSNSSIPVFAQAQAQAGSGNGKITIKLSGRMTLKGTGKIIVK